MHDILVLWGLQGPEILRAFMVDLVLIPEQTKCEERAILSDNKNKKYVQLSVEPTFSQYGRKLLYASKMEGH